MNMLKSKKFRGAALLFLSVISIVILSEAALRIAFLYHRGYFVWLPNTLVIFSVAPEIAPGVRGKARFITDSRGIVADEITTDYTYKILAVGGSTTECLYLDHEEKWPYLLQENLNEMQRNSKIWVGNVGKSGLNSRDHIVELQYLLKQYRDINAIVLLIGVNDLSMRLSQDSDYDPDFLNSANAKQEIFDRVFVNAIYKDGPYYQRTAIWQLLGKIKRAILLLNELEIQDEEGEVYTKWREHRHNAAVLRQTLPDMTSALDEYARNINSIIDLANANSVRAIFLTQPVLWKPSLSDELNDLLWLGGVGDFQIESGKEYYSVEALSMAMSLYNETLLKVCRMRHVECIDLASLLPEDTTVFYDDAHFNESGSKKVAEILAEYLIHNL